MKRCTVRFIPGDRKVSVEKGENLLNAAIDAGISLNAACGGEGVCGKCKVVIVKGDFKTGFSAALNETEREKGRVLACLTSVQSDLEVTVPPESTLELEKGSNVYSKVEKIGKARILDTERLYRFAPLARKLYLELPRPTLDDNLSDLGRVYRSIESTLKSGALFTALSNIKELGALLRENDFKITAAVGDRGNVYEILFFDPQNTQKKCYGAAFDIGTTTISGELINLDTKEILGTATAYNKQASFGSDVITRIVFASNPEGLDRLHKAVVGNINEITRSLCEEYRVRLSDVAAFMAAGNTTMTQLLLNIDPRFIRREPYVPTAAHIDPLHASELGIKINPRGLFSCVPGVATYIGGDIVAGIISSGLCDNKDISVLVDIGTNGEIVLGNQEWMVGASASAGPAFEGSGVTCGMRAVTGAIESFKIGKDLNVSYATIGGKPPKGICGSGYISLLCELFKSKLIDRNGKLNREATTGRIRKSKEGAEFVAAFKKDAAVEGDIVVTEEDIDNLKRAKGSIYSAIMTLLKKMELPLSDVKKIYIAGGFGTCIDVESAVRIGLLPDIDRSVYSFVGNASLAGVRECLLSGDARAKVRSLAEKVTYIDLSSEPKYMDEYIASLFFPHTDSSRFSGVGR